MQLGLIGLGKMGGNMRERIRAAGHTVVGYAPDDPHADASSLPDLVNKLDQSPRVVWLMVPESVVGSVLTELRPLLAPGDVVVDGGNTKWTEDPKHTAYLAENEIHFVDCGVSGGVWGKEFGYGLMAGGDAADIATVQPIFDALRPAPDAGFVHAGKHGAGHYAKMVHNGIEYALMQAYAEGWELLMASDEVEDVTATFAAWREGTVIRSWLLDLAVNALEEDHDLEHIKGYAADSGEGRWTVESAIDLAVPVPTIAAALFARFASRQDDSPAMKMVAAMRNQFGGHAVVEEN